jgi:hypothetical protein
MGVDADLITAGVQTFGPLANAPALPTPPRAPIDDRKND